MRCPHCQTDVLAGESFCGACGHSVSVPVNPPVARRRKPVLLAIAVAVAAAGTGAAAFFVLGLRTDPLVANLTTTALPADSYEGWNVTDKPFIEKDNEPEAGQVGKVQAHLGRAGSRDFGGFVFTIFKTPAASRKSYAESTNSDQAGAQRAGLSMVTPTGMSVSCMGNGRSVSSCRGLAGRTVLFVFFGDKGESEQRAVAVTRSLIAHVSALDK